jgi:hypothetical protein
MDLCNVGRVVRIEERLDSRQRGNEVVRELWIRNLAHDHQQCYPMLYHGRQFIRLVANARVVGHDDPAANTDYFEPPRIWSVRRKVICVPFDS